MRQRARPRPSPRAPDRLLTREERLAVRTSRRWIAGYPNLVAQWHPTHNIDLYPYEVSHGSNLRVWWKCPRGPDHEWQAKAADRVPRNGRKGGGCPFCDGKRFSVTNSLAARFPKLALEWHPTKNAALKAKGVIATAAKLVWWKCADGPDHEWRESVRHRTRTSTVCPFCRGHRLSVTNSLAGRFPNLAKQWHAAKNGKLSPERVKHGDRRAVWWSCERGPDHHWRATIVYRTEQPGCPFCRGKRPSVTNSLAAKHRDLAAQWHPRNHVSADTVQPSSDAKVWWRCSRGADHEWRTSIASRTMNGTGCPFCSSRAVSVTNSLATRVPTVAAEWHPSRNATTPAEVTARSSQSAWWRCSEGHDWEERIVDRTRNAKVGCRVCRSIEGRFPDAAREWHPTKNGALKATDVMPGSRRDIWWRCPTNSRHVWSERPLNKFRLAHGCPFCEKRRGYR